MADWPGLVYSGSERADIWRFTRPNGTEGSLQMQVRMRANNGSVLAEAARMGLGVALQPDFVVRRALDEGGLVSLLEDHRWRISRSTRSTRRPAISPARPARSSIS